jgi:hypothetical protein
MVNENHFRFDHKDFFNFWKTIKTVNCFSKLNFSSLHARLIFDCRNPAMVYRRNPGGAGIWQHPATEIWQHTATVAGCRNPAMVRSWSNLAKSGQNGKDPAGSGRNPAILAESGQTCSPESGNGNQTLTDSGDSCIFAFRNFFVRAKR